MSYHESSSCWPARCSALQPCPRKKGVHHWRDQDCHACREGDLVRAQAIAKQFSDEKVSLIHSIATPTTQAVVKLHKTIPVVFSSITDPVSAGIVPKDSAPGKKTGTNLTGVSDQWPVALQMEIYAKMLPNAKRWGTIYNPSEPNSVIHSGRRPNVDRPALQREENSALRW